MPRNTRAITQPSVIFESGGTVAHILELEVGTQIDFDTDAVSFFEYASIDQLSAALTIQGFGLRNGLADDLPLEYKRSLSLPILAVDSVQVDRSEPVVYFTEDENTVASFRYTTMGGWEDVDVFRASANGETVFEQFGAATNQDVSFELEPGSQLEFSVTASAAQEVVSIENLEFNFVVDELVPIDPANPVFTF